MLLFQRLQSLSLLFLALDVCSPKNCGQRRMSSDRIGGSPWPWMVSITQRVNGRDYPQCSGFLIDHIHVLSPSYPFRSYGMNHTGIQARIGSVDRTRGTVYDVVGLLWEKLGDTTILTLDRPVTEPGFNPVCLPNQEIRRLNLDDERLTVVGWGARKNELAAENTILQQVRGMPVVPNQECRRMYHITLLPLNCREIELEDPYCTWSICAGFPDGSKRICSGAEGGPLMIEKNGSWYAVGMLTYPSCGEGVLPNVFLRISKSFDWIIENLWN